MGRFAGGQMLPGFSGKGHSRGLDLWIAVQEVSSEFLAKFLHAIRRRGSRQGVHGVLHCVSRKNLAVFAMDEAGLEIASEKDIDGPFAKIVVIRMALHLCEADSRFAVAIFGQRHHQVSFPGTSYSRADLGA